MIAQTPDYSRRLLGQGLIIFILGLLSGLAMLAPVELFKNYRMALGAHVIGVLGGMFLLINGLLWPKLQLSTIQARSAFWSTLYGAYGNWVGTLLAAVFGTGSLSRVTAPGFAADAWQESLVTALLSTSGIGTLIACVLFLIGLQAGANQGKV